MSKVKLHFGHLTIRLFLGGMGDSLECQLVKHGLLSFKYLSGKSGIIGKTFKNCFKEIVYHREEFIAE